MNRVYPSHRQMELIPAVARKVEIHYMLAKHLPACYRIENQADSIEPWSEGDFRKRVATEKGAERGFAGIVATLDDQVVGHAVYRRMEAWISVENFRVATWARHCGVGSHLLQSLEAKRTVDRNRVIFRVPERSDDLQIFLREFGYQWNGTERNPGWQTDTYLFRSKA